MKLTKEILRTITLSLKEDIGSGDITTETFLRRNRTQKAHIVAREKGIVCGGEMIRAIFKLIDRSITVRLLKNDGMAVKKGDVVCVIKGPMHSVLRGERVALNFVGYLSGISTLTDMYVKKVKGTGAKIYDTRKTMPGFRRLVKYAVLKGGGCNHRMGLFDQVLIKDNHLKEVEELPVADIVALVRRVRRRIPHGMKIEIEVDTIALLKKIIQARPDIILLDNMKIEALKKALAIIHAENKKSDVCIYTEVSGGVTIKTLRRIALLGVDRISVGAITHSVKNIDFSLEIE